MYKKDDRYQESTELLLMALREICIAVARINVNQDSIWILQHAEEQQEIGQQYNYTQYLESHIEHEPDRGRFLYTLSKEALQRAYESGERSLELIFKNCSVRLSLSLYNSELTGFMIILKSASSDLLRHITNLYVFNNCDYFIYLDTMQDTYFMFSGSNCGTAIPPAYCTHYSTEIVEYIKRVVVPEDQEMVIREMAIERVLEVLDRNDVHTFHCGVHDLAHGYTRKRLEFRYYDAEKKIVLLSRTDITKIFVEEERRRKELHEALERANKDPLTEVLNKQGFIQAVNERLSHPNHKAVLLFVDLDNFKLVNDTYGHPIGDVLLKGVASVISNAVRKTDLVSRYGGDEFVFLLDDTDSLTIACRIAARVSENIQRIVYKENATVFVSCSIGMAFAPKEGATYEELIYLADRRLYQAKKCGKNRWVYE